jgi:hypothetical protein
MKTTLTFPAISCTEEWGNIYYKGKVQINSTQSMRGKYGIDKVVKVTRNVSSYSYNVEVFSSRKGI